MWIDDTYVIPGRPRITVIVRSNAWSLRHISIYVCQILLRNRKIQIDGKNLIDSRSRRERRWPSPCFPASL